MVLELTMNNEGAEGGNEMTKHPSKKTLWGLTAAAAFAAVVCFAANGMANTPGAGIVGSDHDFSALWNTGNNNHAEICVVCHIPHDADSSVTDAPLWNHAVTTASYTPYSGPSGTLDATVGQPGGVSKLCLSCHDGTVAIDAFDGKPGTEFMDDINPARNLGTDLSDDHPISFTYDTALATADGELFDPATQTVSTASETGTINDVLLINGKVECASCHDVHNKDTADGDFLRITRTGSAICLSCHDK